MREESCKELMQRAHSLQSKARGPQHIAAPPVHNGVGHRRRLEELDVGIWVLVQHYAWVECVAGVKQLLELPHDVVRLAAPLHLHIGSHITAWQVESTSRVAVSSMHVCA